MTAVRRVAARRVVERALAGVAVDGAHVTIADGVPRAGDASGPTVVVNYTGSTPEALTFDVEVYVRIDVTADAENVHLQVMDAVDVKLDTASLGPAGDQRTFVPDINSWLGTFTVVVYREDF